MTFKAKLRRIGNSLGIYIPRNVITSNRVGDIIEVNVITSASNVITSTDNVITQNRAKQKAIKRKFNTQWCDKHSTFKGSCGCK